MVDDTPQALWLPTRSLLELQTTATAGKFSKTAVICTCAKLHIHVYADMYTEWVQPYDPAPPPPQKIISKY